MTDWRTIRIPEDDFERHNERRQEAGKTWAGYIDGEAPRLADAVLASLDDRRSRREIDYDRFREIIREEVRAALRDVVQ